MDLDDDDLQIRRRAPPGRDTLPIRFPKGIQPRSRIIKAVERKKEGLTDESLLHIMRQRGIAIEPDKPDVGKEGLMDKRGILEHIESKKLERREPYRRVEREKMDLLGYDENATDSLSDTEGDISIARLLKLKMRLRAKRIVVVLAVLALILTPIFVINIEQPEVQEKPILVNGNFNDWKPIEKFPDGSNEISAFGIPGIDISQVAWYLDGREIYFYIEVSGNTILQGDLDKSSLTGQKNLADSVFIFIDTDPSLNHGYDVYDIKADYMIEIYGYSGVAYSGLIKKFNERYRTYVSRIARSPMDWNAWETIQWVNVKTDGNMMELGFFIDGVTVDKLPELEFVVQTRSSLGYYDFFDRVISMSNPSLFVKRNDNPVELYTAADIMQGGSRLWMFSLELSSENGDSNIEQLLMEKIGTLDDSMVSSILIFEDTDANGRFSSSDTLIHKTLYGFVSGFNEMTLPGGSFIINDDEMKTVHVVAEINNDPEKIQGKTFKIILKRSDIICTSTVTYQKDTAVGDKLHYLISTPEDIVIDGSFSDWLSSPEATVISDNDQQFIKKSSIDILNYGYHISTSELAVYLSMKGTVFEGDELPVFTRFYFTGTSDDEPLTDIDRDGRYDLNNDGIEEQYGSGDDDFDNDNIPDEVDPDLDNDMVHNDVDLEPRDPSVSEYYPDLPEHLGLDIIRVYIDLDGDPKTGYNLAGTNINTGSELLVEFRGRDSIIVYSTVLVYFPSQSGQDGPGWNKDNDLTHKLKFANDLRNLETALELSQFKELIENGNKDEIKFYFVVLNWNGQVMDNSNNLKLDETHADMYLPLNLYSRDDGNYQVLSTYDQYKYKKLSSAYMAMTTVFVAMIFAFLLKIDYFKLKKK